MKRLSALLLIAFMMSGCAVEQPENTATTTQEQTQSTETLEQTQTADPHAAEAGDRQDATVRKGKPRAYIEGAAAHGVWTATLIRDGRIVWIDTFDNVVTTAGKNLALDTFLAGSGYTVTGPYIGLISSTSWSAVADSDTMASHAGWLEAGSTNPPTYTAPRKTAAWSAASGGSKSLSAAASFAITGSGTVKGCFLVFGSGASSTIGNTGGTLYSAGTFSGGDKVVSSGDTLNVSYTASL